MTDPAVNEAERADTVWPLRSWVLAVLGGLLALVMQQLSALPPSGDDWARRLVFGAIAFIGVSGLSFGLAWQRRRLVAAIVIALVCGLVSGGVFLWNGMLDGVAGVDGWHLFSGVLASGLLLTLFQSAQDGWTGWPAERTPAGLVAWKREAILYPEVHGHLWTNAIQLGLSGLFTGLAIGIAYLMAEMFWLLKLDFLRAALREEWFRAILAGTAFGTGLGLLRDRGAIILTLQRVAMLVLRVLAPVVAAGIFVFLVALPFTSLAPLWETGGTTPIMLAGAALALFLVNAVVSDRSQDESRSIILSSSAAALGLFLLPMVGIATFSTGLRIQQYGLSPERLWALTFVIVASIVAIAYLLAIVGARGWFVRLRRTNLHLVFVLAGVALLLSTPIFGFERIATAHQLARLSGGQVSPESFDYKGLWFDFGPPGRAAINRMAAQSSDRTIRRYAAETRKLKDRWEETAAALATRSGPKLSDRLTVIGDPLPDDAELRERLVMPGACGDTAPCTVRYLPQEGVVIGMGERASYAGERGARERTVFAFFRQDGSWSWVSAPGGTPELEKRDAAVARALPTGAVEMRDVPYRQIVIDGVPLGDPFPRDNAAEP